MNDVIPFSLTNFLKRFENPGPKIRGFFLTILEDLKTYFFQFFWKQKYKQNSLV